MKTSTSRMGTLLRVGVFCVSCLAQNDRRLRNSGDSGVVRIPPAFRRRPIRLSNGARRRTFAGRSRFPAEGPDRPSSGVIASIS